MRLTEKQIAEYQVIYLETYGTPISKDDALEQGLALLRMVKNISGFQTINNEKEYHNEPETRGSRTHVSARPS